MIIHKDNTEINKRGNKTLLNQCHKTLDLNSFKHFGNKNLPDKYIILTNEKK